MEVIKTIHSYWAYLMLFILLRSTANAIYKYFGKKEFGGKDFSISLITLIVSHLQLIFGLVLWFTMDYLGTINDIGFGEVMKIQTIRSNAIEHPIAMILAITLITIGYSKHKRTLTSNKKFKTLATFYTLALIFVLIKIPWHVWFS